MKIFVDTSAFIALFVTSEQYHRQVVEKYREYTQENAFFFTNNFVLGELYTRLLYYFDKRRCKRIIEKVRELDNDKKLRIFDIDQVLFSKAETAFLKFAEHKLSMTDATIYICVKAFKMDAVFTLDSDFPKIGLTASF